MLRRRPPRFRAALVAGLAGGLVGGVAVAGCSVDGSTTARSQLAGGEGPPAEASAVRELTPATLHPGAVVPPPSGKVVLVVSGGTTTNVGDELRLDVEQLESLGTVEYEIDDVLATDETATFSGPLMRTVLELAGAQDGTTMHAEALNDYVVDVPVADAFDQPLLLATRMDGKRLSVANYGPTRFVYPTGGDRLDPAENEPRWIWQLRSIEVT
jgi:hypothetical protein